MKRQERMRPPHSPPKRARGGFHGRGRRGPRYPGAHPPGFHRPRFSQSSSDEDGIWDQGPGFMDEFGPPPPPFYDDGPPFDGPPPFLDDPASFDEGPPPFSRGPYRDVPPRRRFEEPPFDHPHPYEPKMKRPRPGDFSESMPRGRGRGHPRGRGGRENPNSSGPGVEHTQHRGQGRGQGSFRGQGTGRGRGFVRGQGHIRGRGQAFRGRGAGSLSHRSYGSDGSSEGDRSMDTTGGRGCGEDSSSTEGAVMSSNDEFEYVYRYGHLDLQNPEEKRFMRQANATPRGKGGTGFVKASAKKPGIQHHPLPAAKTKNAKGMLNISQGVHSLASLQKRGNAIPNLSSMSMAEKLHRFMLFVRDESSHRVNDIQTIENSLTGSHLNLVTDYASEEVGTYQGRRTYSGKLTLSGIFLARAVGQVKKELKHECYKLALQVLKTKTVIEILKQHDIGIDAIRQKFEECSASETESTVGDAVANLATAAPIAVAVETMATMEERWVQFVDHLKGKEFENANAVSFLEMCLSSSRCGLERLYTEMSVMEPVLGKPGFLGSLTLGGSLQAQAQGPKKKEAKQRTYQAALLRFTTATLQELMAGVQPMHVEEFKRDPAKPGRVAVKEIRTPEQVQKLQAFVDRIKDSSVKEGPVTLLDLAANHLQLLLTCMYKKSEDRDALCRLFVGDILISEGCGRQKREAQLDAYMKAYDVLLSTPLETITKENHRLHREELEAADVQDVVVKGQMKKEESNLQRLRAHFPKLDEVLSTKGSEGMVIVEHQDWVDDRKRHAFCILQNSAFKNIMVLKWSTEVYTGFFTCRIHIQGEEVGNATAPSRQQARNLAAADALFRMYETHPVLRSVSKETYDSWVTRDQLAARLSEFPESAFKEVDSELEDQIKKEGEEAEVLTEEEKREKKLDRRLRVVAMKVAEEFIQRGDVLGELVFAPDVPVCVRRFLPASLNKIGLRSSQCQKDGEIYNAFTFKECVDKVVEQMKLRGVTQSSRYLLVTDRSELPCHADIEVDLRAASWKPKPRRSQTTLSSSPETGKPAAGASALNGSLFEDSEEGFVTAQSSMLSDASEKSPTTPQNPATPQTPVIEGSASTQKKKAAVTPVEEVFSRFAHAMLASGVGQTILPVEASTPVRNILVDPPVSGAVTGSRGGPMIKNILISPPQAGCGNVTLSSPMKGLSLASASFPQPDFTASPAQRGRSSTSMSDSNSSTISSYSSNASRSSTGSNVSWQAGQKRPHAAQNLSGSVAIPAKVPATQKSNQSQKFSAAPNKTGSGSATAGKGAASSSGSSGGFWKVPSKYDPKDPSAPHAIQISPVMGYGGRPSPANTQQIGVKDQGGSGKVYQAGSKPAAVGSYNQGNGSQATGGNQPVGKTGGFNQKTSANQGTYQGNFKQGNSGNFTQQGQSSNFTKGSGAVNVNNQVKSGNVNQATGGNFNQQQIASGNLNRGQSGNLTQGQTGNLTRGQTGNLTRVTSGNLTHVTSGNFNHGQSANLTQVTSGNFNSGQSANFNQRNNPVVGNSGNYNQANAGYNQTTGGSLQAGTTANPSYIQPSSSSVQAGTNGTGQTNPNYNQAANNGSVQTGTNQANPSYVQANSGNFQGGTTVTNPANPGYSQAYSAPNQANTGYSSQGAWSGSYDQAATYQGWSDGYYQSWSGNQGAGGMYSNGNQGWGTGTAQVVYTTAVHVENETAPASQN